MFLTKLKIAVSMILVALLIGAGVLLQRTAAQPPGAAQQQSQRSGQAKGKPAANPLIGSWKLISAKYAGQESDLPQTKTTLKHMTPVHYIWVSFGDDGQVYRTGGGPYTFDGETLKSTPEYGFGSSFEAIKGKMQMYKCKVDGNRWHQSGTLSTGETLEEVWERVDKK